MIKPLVLAAVLATCGVLPVESQMGTPPSAHGNLHPAWSPDGRWIAFESDRDGDSEIYVMASDGTQIRQLTRNGTPDQMPDWAPDGKSIRFMAGGPGQDPHQWYQVPVEGGPPRPVDLSPANPDSVQSADGQLTVYTVSDGGSPAGPHGGALALYIKSASAPPRRISPPGHAEEPRLSPDEAWIVFEHRRPGDDLNASLLYLVSSDGKTAARRLTPGTNPSWSPDGQRILFKSWDAARQVLVVSTISPDRGNLRHLADGVIPSWSRDGRHILFMGQRGRQWEILIMSADGSDQRCLTCRNSR